jgi:ankyrin repeat protein
VPRGVPASLAAPQAVELLLRQPDVDVDAPNARRETALMHAAAAGALDVCSRLVAKGASPRAKDVAGCTASSWACKKSYSNMLLFHGMLLVT